MLPGGRGRHAPAWGTHDESEAHEERLAHRFHGFGFFRYRHCQGVQPHRPAPEPFQQRQHDRLVEPIQAQFVDVVQFQRCAGPCQINRTGAMHLGVVAHSAQQPVGDTWGAPRATGNFGRGLGIH